MKGEKDIKVGFIDKSIVKVFNSLKDGRNDERKLHQMLMRAVDDLKVDPFIGIPIPKKLWPKIYIQKYGIDNLRKYNLPNAWRLIYFIRGNDVEIVSVILEWLNHKNYEKRFNY